LTHKDCLTSSDVKYLEYDWYTDITCEEFCEEKWNVHLNNGQKDSTTCYIDDEMPVFIP